jgi:hypothetical protein
MTQKKVFGGALIILVLLFINPILAGLLMVIAFSYVFLSWLLGSGTRPCPRCGQGVEKGVLRCENCGFDFKTIGAQPEQ